MFLRSFIRLFMKLFVNPFCNVFCNVVPSFVLAWSMCTFAACDSAQALCVSEVSTEEPRA